MRMDPCKIRTRKNRTYRISGKSGLPVIQKILRLDQKTVPCEIDIVTPYFLFFFGAGSFFFKIPFSRSLSISSCMELKALKNP